MKTRSEKLVRILVWYNRNQGLQFSAFGSRLTKDNRGLGIFPKRINGFNRSIKRAGDSYGKLHGFEVSSV